MIADEVILEIGMFVFVYFILFALAIRIHSAFNLLAGIAAIFLGIRVMDITGSIPLSILIVAIGVFTIVFGLFSNMKTEL